MARAKSKSFAMPRPYLFDPAAKGTTRMVWPSSIQARRDCSVRWWRARISAGITVWPRDEIVVVIEQSRAGSHKVKQIHRSSCIQLGRFSPRGSSVSFLPAAYHPKMLLRSHARRLPRKNAGSDEQLMSLLRSLAVEPEISTLKRKEKQ